MNDEYNKTTRGEDNRSKKQNLLGITLALLLAIGAFFTGLHSSELIAGDKQVASIFSIFSKPNVAVETNRPDLKEFWEVWDLLDDRFSAASSTQVFTNEEKIYGAISGLVSSYADPYTVFLPPAESEAFAADISGNFGGVGMEVGNRDGVITVIAPLNGTPAEAAGIMAGDFIVEINGESTDGMSIDGAVKRIRGERGTTVSLTIFREGEVEPRKIDVLRDTITIPTVKTEIVGDTFIVSLYSFNAVAEAKMFEAMNEYAKSDATKIILDLRGNPGGYLQSAVSIASIFLPTGKVVVREKFGDDREEKLYRSSGRTLGNRAPEKLVVLVDGGSASASEILAGALNEHGFATLIGVDTFGKGSVQELVEMDGRSALKVTVARWLTPDGQSISDGGLKPDIYIKRTFENRQNEEDPQKDAALKFLRGEEVVSEAKPE